MNEVFEALRRGCDLVLLCDKSMRSVVIRVKKGDKKIERIVTFEDLRQDGESLFNATVLEARTLVE